MAIDNETVEDCVCVTVRYQINIGSLGMAVCLHEQVTHPVSSTLVPWTQPVAQTQFVTVGRVPPGPGTIPTPWSVSPNLPLRVDVSMSGSGPSAGSAGGAGGAEDRDADRMSWLDKQLSAYKPSVDRISRTYINGWLILALCLLFVVTFCGEPAAAEPAIEAPVADANSGDDLADPAEDDSLVSDREKVELVEDSNVSEAVRRRPDLGFKNVTIDGEKASVALEDIPAEQIEAAEVSKAVTPDLDADTRGAALNLRSKATYELEDRVLNGSVETTFNPIIDKFQSKASVSHGRSMGRWGFMLTGTTDQGRHANEYYGQDWERLDSAGGERFVVREQMVAHNQGKVVDYRANGTIDFRIGEHIRIYLKGDVGKSDYEGYNPHLIQRYWLGEFDVTSDTTTAVNGARMGRNLTGWESEGDNYSVTNGGYFDFDRVRADYVLSYNERHYVEPDWFVINFVRDDANLVVDASDPEFAVFTAADNAGFDLNDPGEFRFDRVSSQLFGNDSRELLGTLNTRAPFTLDWARGYVKAGLKYRSLKHKQYSVSDVYTNYQGVFTLEDVVAGYHNTGVIDGRYDHGPMPDLDRSRAFLADNLERFDYSVTESRLDSDPGTWAAQEDISAVYALVHIKRSGLRMVAGLRFEQTELTYEAGEILLDENGEFTEVNRLTDSNRYRNVFPGIHFRYDRGRFSYTGSWSNTIWRPWFGMVVPFRFVNQRDEFIGQGNPELKPMLLESYNVAGDFHVSDDTILSLELAQVTVEDVQFHEVTRVKDGPFAGYKLGTNKNGPTSELHRVRILWNQSLGDIFPALQKVSFNIDYTYTDSESEYPGRPTVKLPMQVTPEQKVQLNIQYNSKSVFAQLQCGYRVEQLVGIDVETWRDRYDFDQYWVSFTSSYSMTNGIRAFVNVHNLLNTSGQRSYLGSESRPIGYNWDPRRFNIGLRVEL